MPRRSRPKRSQARRRFIPKIDARRRAPKACFICGGSARGTRERKPPYRCPSCLAAVAMNEADGEP
jgi:hypothetical protein